MNRRVFDLLVIFILGLLPLLWFPGQTMLFGHDAGIPFDPVTHFLDRFSVWTQRLGIGTDQSFGLLGALPIHGLEAVLIWLGFSIKTQQLIQFCIWFVLPGLTMYFFAYKTWPTKKYLPLIASVIYMMNYYLVQGWFVAERTKFSIYVGVPIIVYYSFSYLLGKTSLKKSALIIGFTWLIFNGGGSFPLYGGLFVLMGIALIYFNFLYFSWQMLKRTFLLLTSTTLLYVLFNAYWIIPYTYYVLSFYSRDLATGGGTVGALAWTEYLSRESTFINLFRGQGIPDWYLNAFHPYSSYFLNNPLLIIISFVFPLLAYGSLLFIKEKKDKFYVLLFALVSLIILIFSAGPRSQLGALFDAMMLHLPGFAIFRSAFYKFTYAQWFAYGILIGFTVDFLLNKLDLKLEKFRKRLNPKYITTFVLLLLIAGYTLYHFPLLNGSFLNYSNEPGKMQTTRVTVPQYVFDFGEWSNQQDPTKRYLIAPELNDTSFVAYKWGYWSLAAINTLQTKNSFVLNTVLIPSSDKVLMSQMYGALLRNDMKGFTGFADVFGIDGIVVHKDVDWQNPTWGTVDPARYEKILDTNPNFKLVKTFGEWKVYDIVNNDRALRVTATPRLSYLHGEINNMVSFPQFDPTNPLFVEGSSDSQSDAHFMSEATDIYVSPNCVRCDLEPVDIKFQYYNPKVLPGSFLYPLVLYKEKSVKKSAIGNFNAYINYLLTVSDRRIIEAKWMIDSKTNVTSVDAALSGYYNSLVELEQFIDKKDWGISSIDENTEAQTIAAHMEEEAGLIETAFKSNQTTTSAKNLLTAAYDKVIKVHQLASDRIWVTQTPYDKRYLFELQKLGEYSVYVQKSSLADMSLLSNPQNMQELTLNLPEEHKSLKPVSEESDWINFGTVDIQNKLLRIELNDTTVKNLLEGVNPVFPSDSTGIKVENGVYTLTTDSQNKCFYLPLKNLDTINKQYIVSFSYRNLSDKISLALLRLNTDEQIAKLSVNNEFLENRPDWTRNRDVQPREKYLLSPKQPDLNLYFCNGFVTLKASTFQKENPSLFPGQEVIQVKDITVNEISTPSIVFYQQKNATEKQNFVESFQKTNSVQYKIKTKPTSKPVTLVMRETYGKYWQLCESGKECISFDDNSHFASAGFSNGWYLKDGIKGDITLNYYPQRAYLTGVFITLGGLVIIIGGICWSIIRKKQ